MGDWKSDAKQDGCKSQGPTARNSGKSPFPTVISSQENPRRMRTQGYDPKPQPREKGVRY